MIVEKRQIQKAIGYEKIHEEVHADYHRFDIMPEDETLPKAYLAFGVSSGDYFLLQAGFGEWHDHFDLYETEEENLKDALSFFRRLVSGECFMAMQADDQGNYLGGSIVEPNSTVNFHAPLSFGFQQKKRRLLKVMFNKPFEDFIA